MTDAISESPTHDAPAEALPMLAPQFPVWFEGGAMLSAIDVQCEACSKSIPMESLAGSLTRPIPTVVNIWGLGKCSCSHISPFCLRVRGPKLTQEWQTADGWKTKSLSAQTSWWKILWSTPAPRAAGLAHMLDAIATDEARTLRQSPWLGVVEAELHGRGYRNLTPDQTQDSPGAILLHGKDNANVVIGTNAASEDAGVPVGPVRLLFPMQVGLCA